MELNLAGTCHCIYDGHAAHLALRLEHAAGLRPGRAGAHRQRCRRGGWRCQRLALSHRWKI
jgi:hypothetical protein